MGFFFNIAIVGAFSVTPRVVSSVTPLLPLKVKAGKAESGSFPSFETSNGNIVLRGANYIRLNGSIGVSPPKPAYHSTFSTSLCNRSRNSGAMKTLAANGFNIVRVFLDDGTIHRSDGINGDWNSTDLNAGYLDNLAAFVEDATSNKIYVIITAYGVPASQEFVCGSNRTEYPNSLLLDPDCIAAKAKYISQLVRGLKTRLGPLISTVLLSMENEVSMSSSILPFSQMSGHFIGVDGKAYSLSSLDERQALADMSYVRWASEANKAAKTIAPEMLVTTGMFSFAAVGKTFITGHGLPQPAPHIDTRVPPRPAIFTSGPDHLDFVDFHVYQTPPAPWNFTEDLASSDWDSLANDMDVPILMGEFGAFRQNPAVFPSSKTAASAMATQQADSCSKRFVGWLFWTQDTNEQPRLWNFDSAPEILSALTPHNRPDPCKP